MAQGMILPKCAAVLLCGLVQMLPGTILVLPCISMAISQHLRSRFPEGVQHPVLGALHPCTVYVEK